jgi:hypothetical protein
MLDEMVEDDDELKESDVDVTEPVQGEPDSNFLLQINLDGEGCSVIVEDIAIDDRPAISPDEEMCWDDAVD